VVTITRTYFVLAPDILLSDTFHDSVARLSVPARKHITCIAVNILNVQLQELVFVLVANCNRGIRHNVPM
jgi:hypothetical protein